MHKEKILILDFGSQFTQLIARRVRELNVFSEIKPCFTEFDPKLTENLKGIVLSGGPASVIEDDRPEFDTRWLQAGIPVLGVCYGMQLLAAELGGEVQSSQRREYGHAQLQITESGQLFEGVGKNGETSVWMSHGDHVEKVPAGFKVLAKSNGIPVAAMGDEARRFYAVQFHAEVVHTQEGTKMLANFVHNICGCKAEWNSSNFIEDTVSAIRKTVGETQNVICGLSGGVDSSVAAVLIHQAIGRRLHCIFVDNGLLRKNESRQVAERMGEKGLGLNLKVVDAADRFLNALKGVTDPEQKRKIIGKVFIDVFDEEAAKVNNAAYLVQGTLYPDVIESESVRGPSAVIKSHHNVGGLPENMKLKLIEPFRELFKDEVRRIGTELKVPQEIVQRQPFPGPGLAIRVLGDITKPKLDLVREADVIIREEIGNAGLYDKVWQSFAVLLPIHSVGVMGDSRTYDQCIAIRAVNSTDGMTADWTYLPHDVLRKISTRIINEVRGINRVVLDISSKPPATIEWE